MSDSNKISSLSSNNNSSSSKSSLLPKHIQQELQRGMKKGYEDGTLELLYNGIKDNMIHELCEWILKLEGKVRKVSLGYNELTSQGASILFDSLRVTNSSVTSVNLMSNKDINDNCMKSLGEYIKSNKNIECIELNNNKITDAGIEILTPYFEGNTTFKKLWISANREITDKSSPFLLKMIESSHMMDMGLYQISTTKTKEIVESLGLNAINKGFDTLSLPGKDLDDKYLIELCDKMKKLGTNNLKEIDFDYNNITPTGISKLLEALKECKSAVAGLNLSQNRIDDEGMQQLGEYLEDSKHLKQLRVGNRITDKGIEILSEYLIGNISLNNLGFYNNKRITDASYPYFIEIANKSFITEIDINQTSISEGKIQEIKEAFSLPINKREIPIKSSTKSAAKIQSSTAST